MSSYNIFIISSPLQLLNAIEAKYHFETKNNILYILHINDTLSLMQIKKLLKYSSWDKIEYINLPQSKVDKIYFPRHTHNILKKWKSKKIEKLFVGDYESTDINHTVNCFNCQNTYLIDDGLSLLGYIRDKRRVEHGKLKLFILSLLFYKVKPIEYKLFSMFESNNLNIIKNNFKFFRNLLSRKEVINSVYFIGQPLVELSIVSKENFEQYLKKILKFYDGKEFIYILHRRESDTFIQSLSKKYSFKVVRFENLIELEMILSNSIPKNFGTFYSTAIMTLPKLIDNTHFNAFKIDEQSLNSDIVAFDTLELFYKEFEKSDIGVEIL